MTARNSAATDRALRRHYIEGMTPRNAARAEGVDQATVYRAIKRRVEAGYTQPRTVIAGGGGLGREVASWVLAERPAARIAWLCDVPTTVSPVIAKFSEYVPEPGDELLLALGDPDARAEAAGRIAAPLATYTSASTIMGIGAEVGLGCLLLPRTIVSAGVRLGRGVILNVHTTVGHDAEVGDWTTISSGVDVTGRVRIGARVFIGSGARLIPGVVVGDGAFVGAGAVVTGDVPAGVTVAGNPARRVSL